MPGSGKQSNEVQAQIKELLEAGFDPTTIHRRLKVGRSSIYRMKRCLEQHGTNYMPPELNKKNGRPKVLTAEQELEVLDWLRVPSNRNRYLDDLVWLIHDRFHIVCSTTTMSKMKRKWLRVIEFEESGQPIDEVTRQQLLETHPDLPLLQGTSATSTHSMDHREHHSHGLGSAINHESGELLTPIDDPSQDLPQDENSNPHPFDQQQPLPSQQDLHLHHTPFPEQELPPDLILSSSHLQPFPSQPNHDDAIQPDLAEHTHTLQPPDHIFPDNQIDLSISGQEDRLHSPPPQIDTRLERRIHDEIATANAAVVTAAAAVAVADGGR